MSQEIRVARELYTGAMMEHMMKHMGCIQSEAIASTAITEHSRAESIRSRWSV